MLRRALALSFVFVLALGTAALAGQALPLPLQVLDLSDLDLAGATDALELIDEVGDIYHPAGSPGFVDPGIDIRRVEVIGWALRGETSENPFLDDSLAGAGIRSGGATDRSFEGGAPYVNVTTTFDGMLPLSGNLFCEFVFAWNNPDFETFQGIDGDLFNGTNNVMVLRGGEAVPGGFEVENLTFFDGGWGTLDPIGWGALGGTQATFTVPYGLFGPAGDAFRTQTLDLLRGGGTDAEPVDMNFGSFCSEGGRSFDPNLGGVDILQTPVDLGAIPIGVVQQQGAAAAPTTTQATPATTVPPATTEATTPPTSVAVGEEGDSGGGLSPAVIAAILGGLAAAAYAVKRAASNTADGDDDRPSGRSFRIAFDSGRSASFADVSGLSLEAGSIEYRDGLESTHTRSMPGIDKHTNITLKRGAAGDVAFWNWVLDSVNDRVSTGGGSISLLSETEPSTKWTFSDSWPTKVEGPGLKSTGAETALESMEITLENLRISGTP